jgi:hypothetical protein
MGPELRDFPCLWVVMHGGLAFQYRSAHTGLSARLNQMRDIFRQPDLHQAAGPI